MFGLYFSCLYIVKLLLFIFSFHGLFVTLNWSDWMLERFEKIVLCMGPDGLFGTSGERTSVGLKNLVC